MALSFLAFLLSSDLPVNIYVSAGGSTFTFGRRGRVYLQDSRSLSSCQLRSCLFCLVTLPHPQAILVVRGTLVLRGRGVHDGGGGILCIIFKRIVGGHSVAFCPPKFTWMRGYGVASNHWALTHTPSFVLFCASA